MIEKFNRKIEVKIHKNTLSSEEADEIIELIKTENVHTILSKLSTTLIRDYLNLAIKSDHIFLFTCKTEKKIIGHALFAEKPRYLISEFSNMKFKILLDLIKKIKFFQLTNILISILKLDLILLDKKHKDLIKDSLNLNLLAINREYQSKGIGKFFFENSIQIIYQNYFKFNLITCEAPTIDAYNFYKKKLDFKLIGKKIRLFKNFFVFLK